MRYILPVAVMLGLAVSTATFGQRKELRKANAAYDEEDYYHCKEYYVQAQELGAVLGLEDQKHLARCYYELNNVPAAWTIYSEIEGSITDEDIYIYARVLNKFGLYEDAINWYDKAKKSGAAPVNAMRINDMIKSCRWAKDNEFSRADGVICNMDLELGFLGQSFGAQYYKDKVVYSYALPGTKNVDKYGNPYLNLFTSDLSDEVVVANTGKVFSENLISPYHVGAAAFTHDLKHIYFTKSVYVDDVPLLKIYVADFNGKEWVNERVVEFDSNDFDLAHPAVSLDDKYLYFVSNMDNGTKLYGKSVKSYGGKDIYRAEISGSDFNHFSKVENLGDEINTYGDEVNPVINPDGYLYFSSDTRPGYGGLDIFCAEYVGEKWVNARNMLQPYNTQYDDFCYVQSPTNSDRGFLSSNRSGDQSQDVICDVFRNYVAEEKADEMPPVFGADGLVFGAENLVQTETPVMETPVEEADLTFIFNPDILSTYKNEIVPGAKVRLLEESTDDEIVSGLSDSNGKTTLTVPTAAIADGKEVIILVTKDGYNEKTLQATAEELEQIAAEGIKLTPIFKSQDLNEINGLVIPYNDDLDDEAKKELDKLATYLLASPGVTVKLNAHTEAKGNRYNNLNISQKMAEKAKDYVVAKGVNADQLIPRGYGERYLKNRCHRGVYCDAAQHKVNRRIEVVVWNVEK